MESIVKQYQPLAIVKKCTDHNQDSVAICISKKCNKNGLVCYICIFNEHNKHIDECIPLSNWKLDIENDGAIDKLINNNLEKAMVRAKDINGMIQCHFSDLFERLIVAKDSLERDGIKALFQSDLPLNYKYQVEGKEYIISKSDLENMLNDFENSFIKQIETRIMREFTRAFKSNNVKKSDIQKTAVRLGTFADNWSQSTSYWDCLGFKVAEDDIYLCGYGVYQWDGNPSRVAVEVLVFENALAESNIIFKEKYNLVDMNIKFEGKVGDFLFGKEIKLEKDKTYIIGRLNTEAGPSTCYGKSPSIPVPPFELISYKGTSDSYKSGNYSDINTGMFAYFLYR
jgi:hypothetical protein